MGNLAVSGLIQMITDAASGSESQYSLGQLTFICIAVVFGIVFALQLEYHTTPRFITKAMEQYKNYAFQEIAKKSISSFSEENASTYISALSNDVNSIETNYLSKIFKLVQESIMFVGAFGMMLYYSPRLTLAAVLFSLLPVLASVLTGNRLAKEEKAVSDKNESFLAAVKDMLSGFSVIKSFKAEKEVSRIFEESNRKAEAAKCQRKRQRCFYRP